MLAVRTGFMSAKGELVKSILYPSPSRFRFQQETQILLLSFLCLCTCTLVSTYHPLFTYHSPWNIIMNIITALTLAVPPEFPIVMSMGILFSLRRLRKQQIFWIDSSKINVAGRISIMVFDKTGTLTEDGLTWNSSKIKKGRHFEKKIKAEDPIPLPVNVFIDNQIYAKNKDNSFLKYCEWMAACHQVTIIRDEYYGDPLDVEMLKTIKWIIPEDDESGIDNKNETFIYPPEIYKEIENNPEYAAISYRLNVVHKFDFSSALQRMSVIVSNSFNQTNPFTMYIKGSPEAIQKLWDEGTYPRDYEQTFK